MERVVYNRNDIAAERLLAYYKRTPVAHVRSFGCQQSVNDGERLKGVLADIGFALSGQPEEADVILFNTCAVREHAEQRVFGNIGALKGLKAAKPGLLIGMCGCMSEEQATVDKLRQSYPYVDLVLGTNIADQLPDILLEKLTGRKKVLRKPEERRDIVEEIPTVRESGSKAFLPIMYGCDNFCSYCIVPYVRGRERSRSSVDILREFKELVADGYKEITLLGQNVNSYGKGLGEGLDFSDLLARLAEVEGEYKLRFMTSHPKDATRKLVDTIASHERICKHLHLPVQSGSNAILSRMNRKYTVEDYLSLVEYAKRACPEMTFSSDVIVGFPGETEEDFNATLALVERVGFTQLFTFIYSKRTGTPAAEMPDDATRAEKTARLETLLRAQEAQMQKVAQPWLGKRFTALVEGCGRKENHTNARLDNNMLLEFEGDVPAGSFVTVEATALCGAMLAGRLV